jgi:recombination protein RecT
MSSEIIKADTAIEKQAENSLMGMLKKYERSFAGVLPKALTAERWRWLIVNNIRAVPALAGCTPVSFLNSVLLAANMGLEIRKNSAYLIPYGSECQLIVDYRGKMELARRAGIGVMSVELIHECDEFEDGWGIGGREFKFKPRYFETSSGVLVPCEDRGRVVAGFGAAQLAHGWQIEVMTLAQIEHVRKSGRGTTGPNSPWVKHWEQMARKSIIHRLCNYLPMTPELAKAQEVDDAEAIGAPMPIAQELASVAYDIDPADNRPMVDGGGETREEQKAALAVVGAAELAKAEARRNKD